MPIHSCPICKKKLKGESPEGGKYFPFCSKRCQMVDLGHWFSDEYVIRGRSQEESNGESAEEEGA